MYTIDKKENRIVPLEKTTFFTLDFKERNHLQEWICNQPDALGEELLIIQKEFDGFEGTNERFDLLALDEKGNLVIIENKRDDSGKDVVWQALKYASYCSALSTKDIVRIYQQYLDKNRIEGKSAEDRIVEFLDDVDNLDGKSLNDKNTQRIIFVASKFRKEVTHTALWLLGHGLSIKCIEITPYIFNEQYFINIKTIVPIPETGDLMVSLANKENDEKNAQEVNKQRHVIRSEYWENLLEVFRKSECRLFDNISISKEHWISAGSGVNSCPYQLVFGQKMLRVCLNIDKANVEENKLIFDSLIKNKEQIEATFGGELKWLRLDDKKSSRIEYEYETDGYNKAEWSNHMDWHINAMIKFEKATKDFLIQAGNELKKQQRLD